MLTRRCCDCGQVKRVELFDLDRGARTGRSAECKECRRQRQNRGGYGVCRPRALAELARRHPDEYERCHERARLEVAPDTAPAEVWEKARGRALAELARRYQDDWHEIFERVRVAHPDWPTGRVFYVATNRHRRAHRQELLDLAIGYAGAKPAGPKVVRKVFRRAHRLLQLAHPAEYQALYAAERAKLGNPVQRPPLEGRAG